MRVDRQSNDSHSVTPSDYSRGPAQRGAASGGREELEE